jgi:hypothetical protein
MVAALAAMGGALREGLAACREYEELRSRGMPHDSALRAALGLGTSPQQRTWATAKPLHFAGRALNPGKAISETLAYPQKPPGIWFEYEIAVQGDD